MSQISWQHNYNFSDDCMYVGHDAYLFIRKTSIESTSLICSNAFPSMLSVNIFTSYPSIVFIFWCFDYFDAKLYWHCAIILRNKYQSRYFFMNTKLHQGWRTLRDMIIKATIVRIELMYYLNLEKFLNQLDADMKIMLAEESKSPPEGTILYIK